MTPIDNLEERLAKLQGSFDQASADRPSQFDPPPDGTYQGLVHEWDHFEGGDPKQAYLKLVLVIVHDEELTGRRAEIVMPLEDPDRIDRLKRNLKLLGADVQNFRLVECVPGSDFLTGLLDTPVEFTVKTSDRINDKTGLPYVNVFIDQRLGEPGSQGSYDPGGQVESDLADRLRGQQDSEADPIDKLPGCSCPDPEHGIYDDNCPVPAHGIPF